MNLKDVAAISGKSGLYKIIKPTRTGVILESIDTQKSKIIANSNTRVSILKEISMYTTGTNSSKALEDIFQAVYAKHGLEIPVSSKADGGDLETFMESVVPDYDKEKVYLSDIKKMVTWYGILAQYYPEIVSTPSIKDAEKEIAPAEPSKVSASAEMSATVEPTKKVKAAKSSK